MAKKKEEIEEIMEEATEEVTEAEVTSEEPEEDTAALREKAEKSDAYLDQLQRTMAEFDNYKKRTQKEKDAIYQDAVAGTVEKLLPVLDNCERAVDATEAETDAEKQMLEGILLIVRQVQEVFEKLGVTEIPAVGEAFDPNLHNAVMHVEDESVGENTIVEVFQKGYQMKERVIRHSMVKVAN